MTSFVMIHGSHNFTNNSTFGISDGGGVSIEQNTTMSINGTTVFQSNLAYGCGDVIYAVNDSTVYLGENIKLIITQHTRMVVGYLEERAQCSLMGSLHLKTIQPKLMLEGFV